ncbi:hypothetical protein NC653_021345 [Populus alba x Populus x berolinensis]|uniref:Uncharacterized protein n=1 Tax=Populus alba x Populus x berolinensis TaxID=444605 RepID=A0AAD6MN52_9ROSI|nr:hypothetical protein NC653_021345 [Populus alba x Populus x berolinensis]
MDSYAIFTVDSSFGGYVASSLSYFSLSFFYSLQLSHFFFFALENALKIKNTQFTVYSISVFFFFFFFFFFFLRFFFLCFFKVFLLFSFFNEYFFF